MATKREAPAGIYFRVWVEATGLAVHVAEGYEHLSYPWLGMRLVRHKAESALLPLDALGVSGTILP